MAVVLSILSAFDDKGVTGAQKRLSDLGSSARGFANSTSADMIKAGASMQRFGDKIANAGKRFTIGFTLPVVAGLGFATKAAMDEQQEMALLDQALRNNADATDEQVAAVERWITATQNATGVADGELRPAMATLLTATKDVGAAQELMGQALDIAAAKGKPVETVATTLMKAYQGNTGALSRLGIQTKDAEGKTLTFDQAMQNAAKTFGGSAAKAADTAAGRTAILKAKLADTAESVGTSLIPMVEKGAEVIGKLADRFAGLSPGTQGFIVKAGLAVAAMGPLLMVTGKFISAGGTMMKVAGNIGLAFGKNAAAAPAYARGIASVARGIAGLNVKTIAATASTVAHKVVSIAAATATKVVAAAQWLLNAALTANPIGIVVVAIGALVAAFVIAWKKSETFRKIVIGAWTAIKTAATAIFNAIVSFVKQWGTKLLAAVAPVAAVAVFVIQHWQQIKDGAVRAFTAVIEWAKSLPGKIKSAVGNLGRTLYNAGADLLRGLWDGIQSIAGWLASKVTGFFSDLLPGWAKKALGIGSPSKVFAAIGRQTAEGLALGMDSSRSLVAASAAALAGAASGGAGMSFAYAGGGFSGSGGPGASVTIAPGAVQVQVDGSGLSAGQLTAAVKSGVEPALVQLAREIRRL